jgi:hypothetical protein
MPPNVFKGEVARAVNGPIPFTLWVLIQYSKQANGNILISTLGMRDFEHMEIETESALPLDQTFDLVRRFGSYILTKGAIVRGGESVSFTADQRINVHHVRSFRADVNENVLLARTYRRSYGAQGCSCEAGSINDDV